MMMMMMMCKTESFRAGKEHCIIQTALHAVMLSSKTAVLVCAFRFSCPPCTHHLSKVGYMSPCPHGGAAHAYRCNFVKCNVKYRSNFNRPKAESNMLLGLAIRLCMPVIEKKLKKINYHHMQS